MSCNKVPKLVATAAAKVGIAASTSWRTFYTGATRGKQWLKTLLQACKEQATLPQPSGPLPTLSGLERINPLQPDELRGRQCAQCQSAPQRKSGLWYRIEGKTYCRDCAPAKAKLAGASLTAPTVSRPDIDFGELHQSTFKPKRTTLKRKIVRTDVVDNLEGYAVLAGGKETGLSLVPNVTVSQKEGRVTVDKKHLLVHYDQANRAVAGPFKGVNQAQGMASLLVRFDWTRPPDEFTAEELDLIKAMSKNYRASMTV